MTIEKLCLFLERIIPNETIKFTDPLQNTIFLPASVNLNSSPFDPQIDSHSLSMKLNTAPVLSLINSALTSDPLSCMRVDSDNVEKAELMI